jgi:hypothetical protein
MSNDGPPPLDLALAAAHRLCALVTVPRVRLFGFRRRQRNIAVADAVNGELIKRPIGDAVLVEPDAAERMEDVLLHMGLQRENFWHIGLLLQLLTRIALHRLGLFDIALAGEPLDLGGGRDSCRANDRRDSAHRRMGFGKLGPELIALIDEGGELRPGKLPA